MLLKLFCELSLFCRLQYRDDPTLPPSTTPGPGEYELIQARSAPHRAGGPTRPPPPRDPFPSSDVPPPGAYDVTLSMRPSPGQSSNFKSSVARFEDGRVEVAGVPARIGKSLTDTELFISSALKGGSAAHRPVTDPLVTAATAVSTGKLRASLAPLPAATVPGPGAYNPQPRKLVCVCDVLVYVCMHVCM